MRAETRTKSKSRLTLHSRIDDLTTLWSWVDALAPERPIPAETHSAIHLCLEEAISNIIRHGYCAGPDQIITVEYKEIAPHDLIFTIEDDAPPFDPIALSVAEPAPPVPPIGELQDGGRGIQLLRKFADTLAYQRLPGGNCLTIGFRIPG
jgi:anti-sigma regulatory factor (Ser/Thr protein kinase)